MNILCMDCNKRFACMAGSFQCNDCQNTFFTKLRNKYGRAKNKDKEIYKQVKKLHEDGYLGYEIAGMIGVSGEVAYKFVNQLKAEG